jgi:hypothetical protein
MPAGSAAEVAADYDERALQQVEQLMAVQRSILLRIEESGGEQRGDGGTSAFPRQCRLIEDGIHR